MKIIVFDTETTSKFPALPKDVKFDDIVYNLKHPEWSRILDKWSHIIQLSYIVYDSESPERSKIYNEYIDIPKYIHISKYASDVHHITHESLARCKRVSIKEAIYTFMTDLQQCDIAVGHNVLFDKKMMIIELLRLKLEDSLFLRILTNMTYDCTMRLTTSICNIKMDVKYKNKTVQKNKAPKLSEAFTHYFGHSPNECVLHNSIIDVVICLRIYCKYKFNEDIYGKNNEIDNYIYKLCDDRFVKCCKSFLKTI